MNDLYKELPRDEVVKLISTVGHQVTFLVEGHMGSSKTAILSDLAEQFKGTHRPVYIDCCLTALEDFRMPTVNHDSRTSSFYPNEVLGLHEDRPMIIMFDEFGKANVSVKNAVLPMLIERRLENTKFHPETIVFATTNLGAENVGDMFKPHERNRMTFVRMAKPTADEWVAWGVNNDLAPEVLAWVNQNPHCFASFDEVSGPDDNHYIYHPKSPRTAFVTHRSMAQASNLVKQRQILGEDSLTHALIGTIGPAAAMDMMSFVRMGDELPSRKEILANPEGAPVPKSPAAIIMLCVQSIGWLAADTVDPWMTYMERFPMKEAAAMWCNLVIRANKIQTVATHKSFTKFAIENGYLFK